MQKCVFFSLLWCCNIFLIQLNCFLPMKIEKTITLQSSYKNSNWFFSLLRWATQTTKTKEFMFQNLAHRPTVYKTGVHTNFVDIDLFYPLLILHAKNVKLQWKFAKFLSNQFVLQLPFFFVITYNFAFLWSYSRYMVSNRYI